MNQNASIESFEAAPANTHQWDLTAYQFKCPLLPTDSGKELREIASIRLPEYHQLVDHTLAVAWKSVSKQRKEVQNLLPDQIIWALKTIEAHRSGPTRDSEDMRLLIQYLHEIVVSMCAGGGSPSIGKAHTSSLEEVELLENSYVVTNMRGADETCMEAPSRSVIPTAESTRMPFAPPSPIPSTYSPKVQQSPRGSIDRSSRKSLIRNLESLHQMLVRWKQDQLKRIDIDMEQLKAIESLLVSMSDEGQNRRSPQP